MTTVMVKTPADYTQTDWSGGETNQLFLYPEDGDYKRENSLIASQSQLWPYDRQPLPYLMAITGS